MNYILRSILFITIGLAIGGVICYFAPSTFNSSYKEALVTQYDYYRNISNSGKILVVGGSSATFGIDLDAMEAKTGRPCAEMGNDWMIGYGFLLEMSKCNLRSGDVVIIELTDKKIVDGFNTEAILSTLGRRKDMYCCFARRFWPKVIADYPKYILKCYFYSKVKVQDNGGFDESVFDNRGSIVCRGDEQNPPSLDAISKRNEPFPHPDAFPQETMDFLNDYVDYCKSLNVDVFFTLETYYEEYYDWRDVDIDRFSEQLSSRLHAPVITNLKDSIYPRKYIWSHQHHLNAAGAIIRSERLAEALKSRFESE